MEQKEDADLRSFTKDGPHRGQGGPRPLALPRGLEVLEAGLNSLLKASAGARGTVRCLPMMISAIPRFASVGCAPIPE